LTVVIIAGGLVLGVFTATEAGAVAAVYALILSLIYKELSWRDLGPVLARAASTTGMVMLLVVTSSIFGIVMTMLRIPESLATFFLSLSNNPLHVFLLINILLLLVGTFLDPTPIIIILAPLLMPIIMRMGIDPVHFGVVFTINMVFAQISPPAGVPLFVSAGIADIPIGKVFVPVLPFLGATATVLVLVTYVPELVLFLPRLILP
ncbi:partial C4-dicarboxylate TRAP transporter large permease protein DctM, partial [Anaerolineae bacterium]